MSTIRSCKEIESGDKRTDSIHKVEHTCPWMFGFIIETHDRIFQLHSPIRQDRDHWMKIFKILVKMANAGISTKTVNPFNFEKQ